MISNFFVSIPDETAKDPTEPRKFSVCFGTVDTILCVNNKFRVSINFVN